MEERRKKEKNELPGSSPLSGGQRMVILLLAGTAGQQSTVSKVALHHNEPSPVNAIFKYSIRSIVLICID